MPSPTREIVILERNAQWSDRISFVLDSIALLQSDKARTVVDACPYSMTLSVRETGGVFPIPTGEILSLRSRMTKQDLQGCQCVSVK